MTTGCHDCLSWMDILKRWYMDNSIVPQLDKAFYVRSKISYYPLSQNIVPVPDGISAIIFQNQQDIDEYFSICGISDLKDYEILRINSFYDFMQEMAEMGFIGFWYYNNYPILFGNYISDIDIDLPSFAYTLRKQFIGASGDIESLQHFLPWQNYSRTDKIIRRFVQFDNGLPFDTKEPLFTIIYTEDKYADQILGGTEEQYIRYSRFPDASSLQGPYVSDMGAYCLFTREEYAQRYLSMNSGRERSIYAIDKVDDIWSFLDFITKVSPGVDIGINPGNARYCQGYFLPTPERRLVKTVLGVYELANDCEFKAIDDIEVISATAIKSDTIGRSNTIDPLLRGFQSTIKYPLKSILGTTKSSLPQREAEQLLKKIAINSKYTNYPQEGYVSIEGKDIFSDSFLVYGFDKISGHPFGNNEEMVTPFVFTDIVDAVLYFCHVHMPFEYDLRLEGFYYCASNTKYEGSQNKQLEEYVLSEQRLALQGMIESILIHGYKIEHSELLKSYVNRSSISLEIEECGYLGDLGIFKEEYLNSYVSENEDNSIHLKIFGSANKWRTRLNSKVNLDATYQNKIRLFIGHPYKYLTLESLCILETALRQFENAEHRINYDYAGITMKLCKVYERELGILFRNWRSKVLQNVTREILKNHLRGAEECKDETMSKLTGWLLKRNKLELGSMAYIVKRIVEQCDNDILNNLRECMVASSNSDFILSQEFPEICRTISTRYRNGGVHEKIVTYEICKEAFEVILTGKDNYLKRLADV
jgi:hypothetical protein